MADAEAPPPAQPPPSAPPAEPATHNRWKWIAIVLGVVSIGLLVWAIGEADKNDLQSQVDQGKESGSTFVTSSKALYDEVTNQLGSTNEESGEHGAGSRRLPEGS